MKGRLGYDKWSVIHTGASSYMGERIKNGKTEVVYEHSHCLQCAKSDILAKYGGRVDTRGWHLSNCGAFMLAMQKGIIEEEKENGNLHNSAYLMTTS